MWKLIWFDYLDSEVWIVSDMHDYMRLYALQRIKLHRFMLHKQNE